jgi:hypothetical protein
MDTHPDTPGTVYYVGGEAAASALLYAGQTNRTCCPAEAAVSAPTSNDLIICTTKHLSARLLGHLYIGRPERTAPGLLFAPSEDDLHSLCKLKADEMATPSPAIGKRVFVYSDKDFSELQRGEDSIIGGNVSSERLLSLVGSRPSVLTIIGHSDGIDLRLSQKQFACTFLDSAPTPSPLLPHCQVVGHCTRFPSWPRVTDAHKAGWIVPTSSLRAEIGIIFGCNVLRLNDGVVDPANSLAARLLRLSGLRVLITLWRREIVLADGAFLNGLINDLCTGHTVGSAVATFNKSALSERYGIKLCIVGDPRFSLPAGQTFARLPVSELPAPTSKSTIAARPSEASAISLLREIIVSTAGQAAYDRSKGLALAEGLRRHTAYNQLHGHDRQGHLRTLDEALLDFLSPAARLDLLYGPFSQLEWVHENAVCASCFDQARLLRRNFLRYRVKARTLIRCANCGDSFDAPDDWNIRLDLSRLDQGLVAITGVSAGALGQSTLVVSESSSAGRMKGPVHQIQRLPDTTASTLVFRLPQQLPSFALCCEVAIVSQLELGGIAFKLRKLPGGRIFTLSNSRVPGSGETLRQMT